MLVVDSYLEASSATNHFENFSEIEPDYVESITSSKRRKTKRKATETNESPSVNPLAEIKGNLYRT